MSNQQAGEPGVPDPDTVREEAERLVATGLAAVSMVADRIGAPSRERGGSVAAGYDALGNMLFGPAGHRRHSVANESPECCRCPVCRVISAAREPNPNVAERLATGVGTVAEGAARVLRGLAGAAGTVFEGRPRSGGIHAEAPRPAPPAGQRDEAWETDPWAAATAPPAAPPSAPGAAPAPVEPPTQEPPVQEPPAGPAPAGTAPTKKAATKQAAAKEAPAKQAATKKVAKKAVKKAPAKKASAKKAAPKPAPGEADR